MDWPSSQTKMECWHTCAASEMFLVKRGRGWANFLEKYLNLAISP